MKYDVIIVGAGHAGIEAALAGSRLGCAVLVVTSNLDYIGEMSCNPSIGGVAKGTIVREIDALGGAMGRLADQCGIQFRVLNRSKGRAVHGLRAQVDRFSYRERARRALEEAPGVSLLQDMVVSVHTRGGEFAFLETESGYTVFAKSCVVTAGTFLNGEAHIGDRRVSCGRMGERAAYGLVESLCSLGIESGRLKTGTPARIAADSVDYSRLHVQRGDAEPVPFSYSTDFELDNTGLCWEVRTNPDTHEIIRNNLDRSPVYGLKTVTGTGPRYCPSIEDKLVRFGDRSGHGLFLEPEGVGRKEMYLSGFSTSLPAEVQVQMVQSLEGFSAAQILKPAYAVEYAYFPPNQLRKTLESRRVFGLFFAGQVNGTSGYEEAAGQGVVAGVNAACRARGDESFELERHEAYIGVLIDDLVVKGTSEPYRMFTSRAEYRLMLRYDTSDERLMPRAFERGLVGEGLYEKRRREWEYKRSLRSRLSGMKVPREVSRDVLGVSVSQGERADVLLRRPEVSVFDMVSLMGEGVESCSREFLRGLEADIKYEGFIKKHLEEIDRVRRYENMAIPEEFEYTNVEGLLLESREKLSVVAPLTVGQASRVPGITPADVSVLVLSLTRNNSYGVSRET
jgi:tRNA uridine 5-carboxymethylaminomethyl modification enzyme